MEINELAKALRTILAQGSPQLALASLSGNGQAGFQLPGEFDAAARTLAGRQREAREGSILGHNAHWI